LSITNGYCFTAYMLNLDIDGTQLTALLIQYFIKKGGGGGEPLSS
jgi:hypothetical protein